MYLILRYAKFAFLKDKSNEGGNLSPPPLRPSNKYYLAVDDFGRPILYIVHPADPHHLVSSFQLFCYASATANCFTNDQTFPLPVGQYQL